MKIIIGTGFRYNTLKLVLDPISPSALFKTTTQLPHLPEDSNYEIIKYGKFFPNKKTDLTDKLYTIDLDSNTNNIIINLLLKYIEKKNLLLAVEYAFIFQSKLHVIREKKGMTLRTKLLSNMTVLIDGMLTPAEKTVINIVKKVFSLLRFLKNKYDARIGNVNCDSIYIDEDDNIMLSDFKDADIKFEQMDVKYNVRKRDDVNINPSITLDSAGEYYKVNSWETFRIEDPFEESVVVLPLEWDYIIFTASLLSIQPVYRTIINSNRLYKALLKLPFHPESRILLESRFSRDRDSLADVRFRKGLKVWQALEK